MANFTVNTPISTDTPTITVEGSLPGTHRFQLVVKDESGNLSQPAIVDVKVLPPNPATFAVKVSQPQVLKHDAVSNELWVLSPGQVPSAAGQVSVVNVATRAVTGSLAVGSAPADIALTGKATRRIALVTNSGSASVTAIDMNKHALLKGFDTAPQPLGVDISPDGHWGYVVSSGAPGAASALTVIDLTTMALTTRVPLGSLPTRVVFAPNGSEAYVNNSGDGTISVITVGPHKVADVIKVGGSPKSNPQQVAPAQTGYPLWSANPGTSTASRIAADHSVLDGKAGIAANAIAVSSKGDMALAVGPADKALAVFNAAGQARLVALSSSSGGPGSVALAPGDKLALVTHPAANLLSLVDSQVLQVLATVPTPANPGRIVVTADGKLACIACQKADSVLFVDLTGLIA